MKKRPIPRRTSPFQPPTFAEHKKSWNKCRLCDLCTTRKHVVLLRGTVPCDFLFIGEAPGASEDVLGQPFVGPAGHLLDQMISKAGFGDADHDIRPPKLAFTNLVACIPKGEDSRKAGEPPLESIEACAPRLREVVALCRPRALVLVGKLSQKHVPKILEGFNARSPEPRRDGKPRPHGNGFRNRRNAGTGSRSGSMGRGSHIPTVHGGNLRYFKIIHPAALLRLDISQKGLAIQQTVLELSDMLAEMTLSHGV